MSAPLSVAGACNSGAPDAGASVGAVDAGAWLGAVLVVPAPQAAATMTTPMSSPASRICRFIGFVLLLSL